jgi:hypothetical protein
MLSIFFIDISLNNRIGNINYRYIPAFLRINDTGEHNSRSCHHWRTHILLCDAISLLMPPITFRALINPSCFCSTKM